MVWRLTASPVRPSGKPWHDNVTTRLVAAPHVGMSLHPRRPTLSVVMGRERLLATLRGAD